MARVQYRDQPNPNDVIGGDASTVTHFDGSGSPRVSDFQPLGDARFPPGYIFATRYRIVSMLGRGATGEVYRADDLKLGQRVALKLLAPTSGMHRRFVERFIGEVRLARDIAHPNVCRVYDIGEAESWHYLSMEYIDGETLGSLLRRIGSLPAEKALDVARQLCAGLAAAHDRGVLHRDLKPGNIMLDGRGQVRIVDLGFATPIADPKSDVAGTPAYMAPEQLRGEYASERSDLFALGAVLYEVFTGHRLFRARSFAERLASAEGGPPALARLAGIDPAVEIAIRELSRNRSGGSAGIRVGGGGSTAGWRSARRRPGRGPHAVSGDDRGRWTTRCVATGHRVDTSRRGHRGNARCRVPGAPHHADRCGADSEAAGSARRARAHDPVERRSCRRGARHRTLVRTGHPLRVPPEPAIPRAAELDALRERERFRRTTSLEWRQSCSIRRAV